MYISGILAEKRDLTCLFIKTVSIIYSIEVFIMSTTQRVSLNTDVSATEFCMARNFYNWPIISTQAILFYFLYIWEMILDLFAAE